MSASLSSSLLTLFLLFPPSLPAQTALTIATAADLSALQQPLSEAFRKNEPNGSSDRLRFVIGASAALAQQIRNGAPYDIFLSANAQYVDQLASSRNLDPGSIRVYAVGQVGLLWSGGKHRPISDLAQNWVRFVALPNPHLAPYGVAAQQVIEHAGLWSKVQPKVVYGNNVREALELLTSGNADAVLTSASLLKGKNPELIPSDWHAPIVQKGGIVGSSRNRQSAERFMNFLTSPAGQAVFAQFGFGPPPKP